MPDNNMNIQNTPSPFPPPTADAAAQGPAVPLAANQVASMQHVQQPAPSPSADMSVPQAAQQDADQEQQPAYTITSAGSYFTSGTFSKDVADYQSYGNRTTGYKNLDIIQPFYPGFYALGSISSLGKTTFTQQLADQIAAAGQWVLYFSLEQTCFELFSKSLSRGFYRTHREDMRQNNHSSTYPTPSSIDIRRGVAYDFPAELASQIDGYIKSVDNRIYVIDGAFCVTVEDIVQLTELFIKEMEQNPVVIVDYLQIIAPSLINSRIPDTKTSIDHIVHTLKAMQSRYKLTVIAISSLNRQNYMTTIDFESFKESGGIEYTADVVWGLQLSLLSSREFYHHYDINGNKKGETSLKEKREMIQQAKSSVPRIIDLVCLKNRYGCSNYTVTFDYYPANDTFYPAYDRRNPLTYY